MSFLSNPLIVGGIVAAVGAVATGGAYLYAKRGTPTGGRKEVILLRPGFRGLIVPVTKETAKSLECKKTEGVLRKFYIYGRGWVFPKGTKFLAVDGSAYTKIIRGVEEVKVSVPDYLRLLWGDVAYDSNRFPKVLREAIEKTVVGVTITPDRISDDDKGLPRIDAEDVNEEDEKTIAKGLKSAVEDSQKPNLVQAILFMAVGAFVTYILCNIHVLPVALKGG
jgi:hypothetical protein